MRFFLGVSALDRESHRRLGGGASYPSEVTPKLVHVFVDQVSRRRSVSHMKRSAKVKKANDTLATLH